MPLLELENVVTYYGPIRILKGLSLRVYPGEVVSLLGGNAAGKSTTMKAILGLVTPDSGEIRFNGERINGLPPSKIIPRGIVPVPEARRLFPSMSVRENLMMGAYARRRKLRGELDAEIEEILEMFPRLRERISSPAGTLSGGEQQMVAVGRALLSHPKMILMDEPSMGLSPALVEKVYEVIQQICARKTTMLIVEQNATMALSIATRGYVLQGGEIVLSDTAQNLLRDERVRAAYLGSS